MYHTEPPTDKTIREWYTNSSRVAACAAKRTGRPGLWALQFHVVPPSKQYSFKTPDDGRRDRPKSVE